MKSPTAEPQAQKRAHGADIGTWLSVVVVIIALIKIGIFASRHM